MAAEAQRAPSVREHPVAPAIQRGDFTVNRVPDAIENVAFRCERNRAVLHSALGELQDLTTRVPEGDANGTFASRLNDAWLVLEVFAEQFAEIEHALAAITDKARKERRAVTA